MSSPSVTSDANKPVRLIFVDDDDDYREAAAAELVALGFAVESFADGASMHTVPTTSQRYQASRATAATGGGSRA